jgi:hypothetical protein
MGVCGLAGVGAANVGLLLLLHTQVMDQDMTKTMQWMIWIGNDAKFKLQNQKPNQLWKSKKRQKRW